MKKSGFIIIVLIGVIVLGIMLGMTGKPEDKENLQNLNTNKSNVENNQKNIQNTESNNNNDENQNIVNEESNVENNENNQTENIKEEPKTEKDKAIELVKLDYGSNADNVSIKVEGINNDGTYVISVRDKNTTQALAFYTVNVNDKTFTKREMN